MISDEELTRIYHEANGLDPKKHNPITTERIFKAMRAVAEAAHTEAIFNFEQYQSLGEEAVKLHERIDALEAELAEAEKIVGEAKNLISQRGRHNTEIAYNRLKAAIDAAAARKEAGNEQD